MKKQSNECIGERIKDERIRLGLTQAEFSARAGVTPNTQGLYEKASRKPDSQYLQAVAEAGADVQYIITGEYTQTPGLNPRVSALLDDLAVLDDADRRCLEQLAHSLALAVISKKESD